MDVWSFTKHYTIVILLILACIIPTYQPTLQSKKQTILVEVAWMSYLVIVYGTLLLCVFVWCHKPHLKSSIKQILIVLYNYLSYSISHTSVCWKTTLLKEMQNSLVTYFASITCLKIILSINIYVTFLSSFLLKCFICTITLGTLFECLLPPRLIVCTTISHDLIDNQMHKGCRNNTITTQKNRLCIIKLERVFQII